MNSAGETPEWQSRIKDAIGENPAHFLDRDLVQNGHNQLLPDMIHDRIKGIDRLDVLNAWRAAERKLQRGQDIQSLPDEVDADALDFHEHDIEPGRKRVLDALDDREAYLREHGERSDRVQRVNRTVPRKDVFWVRRDRAGDVVERREWSKRPTRPSVGRSFPSSSSAQEVWADGGRVTRSGESS